MMKMGTVKKLVAEKLLPKPAEDKRKLARLLESHNFSYFSRCFYFRAFGF